MSHNFADLFEHAVDVMPERTALIEGDRALTLAELDARANRLADHLGSIRVGPGTHVGFQMHNGIETMTTLIACFKLRAVPININYRYGVEELRYLYDNADLEVLVCHAKYADTALAGLADTPSIRVLIVDDRPPPRISTDTTITAADSSASYEQALLSSSPARRAVDRSPDDLFMMYTGGTTGRPKGVMWRQEDMWRVLGGGIDFYTNEPVSDEYQQSRVGAQGEPSTWFILPPLIHAAAMMPSFTALWSGNAVIFEPKFDAQRVWRVVEQHRPQIMVMPWRVH